MASPSLRHGIPRTLPPVVVGPRGLALLIGLCLGCLLGGAYFLFGDATVGFGSPLASFACLFLLSVTVFLPLSIHPHVGRSCAGFSIEPVVCVNALYFVVGPGLALVFSPRILALTAWPMALLVLSLGFFLLYLGVGTALRAMHVGPGQGKRESAALPAALVASVAVLWALRLFLLAEGLAITHGPGLDDYSRGLGTWVVVAAALAYVPISLCLARKCRDPVGSTGGRVWSIVLLCIVVSDSLYYVIIGSRLPLLWEFVILFWVWRSRPGRVPGKLVVAGLLAFLVAIPLTYAQRALLGEWNLRPRQDQMKFVSERVLPGEENLGEHGLWKVTESGFSSDAAYRLNAVAWFSRVAYQHFNANYPLLMGRSWEYGLAFVVPRALWHNKPVQENIDRMVDLHFGIPPKDELTTTETETFANFGVFGFWVWMFFFGALAGWLVMRLSAEGAGRESTLFLIICLLPVLFLTETDTVSMLAAMRVPLVVWLLLRFFERPALRATAAAAARRPLMGTGQGM